MEVFGLNLELSTYITGNVIKEMIKLTQGLAKLTTDEPQVCAVYQ